MEKDRTDVSYRSVVGWGNRGWLEIIDMILSVSEQGALKTHVMYRCNLNSKQVKQYLDFVVTRGLVKVSHDSHDAKRVIYTTTERGRKFTRAYNELAGMFSIKAEGTSPPIDIGEGDERLHVG